MAHKLSCCDTDREYIRRRLIRTVDEIVQSALFLSGLINQLDLMDVRHDDFANDADLQEHHLQLEAIVKGLYEAGAAGRGLG